MTTLVKKGIRSLLPQKAELSSDRMPVHNLFGEELINKSLDERPLSINRIRLESASLIF